MIKIGITSNILKRFKTFEYSGCVEIKREWISELCLNARENEKELHGLFINKRVIGEWFRIDFMEAVKAAKNLKYIYIIEQPNNHKEINIDLNVDKDIRNKFMEQTEEYYRLKYKLENPWIIQNWKKLNDSKNRCKKYSDKKYRGSFYYYNPIDQSIMRCKGTIPNRIRKFSFFILELSCKFSLCFYKLAQIIENKLNKKCIDSLKLNAIK